MLQCYRNIGHVESGLAVVQRHGSHEHFAILHDVTGDRRRADDSYPVLCICEVF